jgi:hypothetical protein
MEMQQTHYYTTGTATLPGKCNMVHRSCYQGKPNMSQYIDDRCKTCPHKNIWLRKDASHRNLESVGTQHETTTTTTYGT